MNREVEKEGRGLMLLKFILFSVIAYVVIRFVRGLFTGLNGKPSSASAGNGQTTPRRTAKRASSALMIRCAACGTFITESSAVLSGSRIFCSDSCAKVPIQRT